MLYQPLKLKNPLLKHHGYIQDLHRCHVQHPHLFVKINSIFWNEVILIETIIFIYTYYLYIHMTNFSIRIDPELKKKMDSLRHLNWSEIIRKAIRSEIRNETEISKAKAVLLNEKIRKKAPENFESLEIIRKFREERH